MHELKGIRTLGPVRAEVQAWLQECDRFKFSGVSVSMEEKQGHYGKLLDLAEKIESLKEDAKKEGAA